MRDFTSDKIKDIKPSGIRKFFDIANKIEVIGDDINDFEMLSNFEGVVMETHDQILDKLNKKSVSSVHSFIDENI